MSACPSTPSPPKKKRPTSPPATPVKRPKHDTDSKRNLFGATAATTPEKVQEEKLDDVWKSFGSWKRIDNGSFSMVYSATPLSGGEPRAFKNYRISKRRSYAIVKQSAQREYELVSLIGDHPHILKYHRLWMNSIDEDLFVEMDLCEEGHPFHIFTLCDVKEAETKGVELLTQMVSALKAIHAKQIVHLDIKPQNILLHKQEANGKNKWVIGDFGYVFFILLFCLGLIVVCLANRVVLMSMRSIKMRHIPWMMAIHCIWHLNYYPIRPPRLVRLIFTRWD
jgi:hypothetical protein